MTSAFDRIDRQHRQAPRVALEAFEEGQDCPKPRCAGRLELRPFGRCLCHETAPCYGCENAFLACNAPGCGWSERQVRP